jgi:hypothetical protein
LDQITEKFVKRTIEEALEDWLPQAEEFQPMLDRLSTKQKKRMRVAAKELKSAFSERLNAQPAPAHQAVQHPDDQMFEEGVNWLDALAGDHTIAPSRLF